MLRSTGFTVRSCRQFVDHSNKASPARSAKIYLVRNYRSTYHLFSNFPADPIGGPDHGHNPTHVDYRALRREGLERHRTGVGRAAGSTGLLACQIARAAGARVVGIAGGESKCRMLVDEMGLDYLDRMDRILQEMEQWVLEGSLQFRNTQVDGLENAQAALPRLFGGDHTGKLVVRVA